MASGRMRINEDLFKDIFNEALAMKAGYKSLKKHFKELTKFIIFILL